MHVRRHRPLEMARGRNSFSIFDDSARVAEALARCRLLAEAEPWTRIIR